MASPRIEKKASELLSRAGQSSMPVDPAQLADYLGIEVRLEQFEGDVSGLLLRQPDRTIIAINKADAPARRRFTIAHELGHFVLKHQGEIFVDHSTINRRDSRSSAAIDKQEIEANAFAAALLMPTEWVVAEAEALFDAGVDPSNVGAQLANRFGVSQHAMNFRLVNLGLIQPPN